jgi:hypothetical protein
MPLCCIATRRDNGGTTTYNSTDRMLEVVLEDGNSVEINALARVREALRSIIGRSQIPHLKENEGNHSVLDNKQIFSSEEKLLTF